MKPKILTVAIWSIALFSLNLAYAYHPLSPYAYCANNPVKFVDPNGKEYYPSTGGAVIWQDNDQKSITINDEIFNNIGKSYSMQICDGSYVNYYQNVAVSISPEAVDAERTVLGNTALAGNLLSESSPLAAGAQQGLMTDLIHQGQSDFINHPVTQTSIGVLTFVATGGIEGIAAITKAAGCLATRQAAIQTTKIVGNTVTGFTEHGLNQVINRGFKPQNILQILKNGQKVQSIGRYGPQIKYTLHGNTIVVNEAGKIVTAFGPRPGTFIPF